MHAFNVLRARYQHRQDVFVAGDLLIYYEEGKPAKRVAPDVFVAFGAAKGDRNIYKLWEEGKAPDFFWRWRPNPLGVRTQGRSGRYTHSWGLGSIGCVTRRANSTPRYCRGSCWRMESTGHCAHAGRRDSWWCAAGRWAWTCGEDLHTYEALAAEHHRMEKLRKQEATARQVAEARAAELEERLRKLEAQRP